MTILCTFCEGLHFGASWLKSKKEFREELGKFIDEMLSKNDVFFVTMLQVIQWMQNPTEVNALRDFQDWKGKIDYSSLQKFHLLIRLGHQ